MFELYCMSTIVGPLIDPIVPIIDTGYPATDSDGRTFRLSFVANFGVEVYTSEMSTGLEISMDPASGWPFARNPEKE
jgi:hypothetical protein